MAIKHRAISIATPFCGVIANTPHHAPLIAMPEIQPSPTPLPHEPRLTQALHMLLDAQRVAALGTLGADGLPFVSMVPFALETMTPCLVIHVSALAPHTRNLQTNAAVSVMVMQAERAEAPVHALPRVTLQGLAAVLAPGSTSWTAARAAYLNRFPEAEPMTQLGDFMFVAITLQAAHQVAGFGAARSLDAATLAQVLQATVANRI